MRMYLKGKYRFQDEFESKVIDGLIQTTKNLTYKKEEGCYKYYTLKENNIKYFKEELGMERQRQWEKGLFKKRETRTYKEISKMKDILKIMEDYLNEVEDKEDIIIFRVGVDEERFNL